jgi:hypothetical protein
MNGPVLTLIGCADHDLVDLPQRLAASGLEVRSAGVVQDGDHVVFCISCCHGPTDGTRLAVASCAGRTVAPVAIVLTQAELVDDDSLRELVTLEEMELLCLILQHAEVGRLPLLYDFDPLLATKLRSWMDAGIPGIRCAG